MTRETGLYAPTNHEPATLRIEHRIAAREASSHTKREEHLPKLGIITS